jgi:hypothetical protein
VVHGRQLAACDRAAGGNSVRIVNNDATNRTVTFNFNYVAPLDEITINQNGAGTNTLLMGVNQLLAGSLTLGDTGRGVVSQPGGIVGITDSIRLGTTSIGSARTT